MFSFNSSWVITVGLAHHGGMTLLFIFTEQLTVCEGAQRQNCRHDWALLLGGRFILRVKERKYPETPGRVQSRGGAGKQGKRKSIAETAEESRAQPAGE